MNAADAEYWRALGKFVEIFAMTEAALFTYVEEESGMTRVTARLVAASWRTGNMLQFITELWKAEPLPASQDALRKSVDQLKHILKLRNSIIHYRSRPDFDPELPRISSNVGRHVPTKQTMEYRVSAAILDDCVSDRLTIWSCFTSYRMQRTAPRAEREPAQGLDLTWRYKLLVNPRPKPPRQKTSRRKT